MSAKLSAQQEMFCQAYASGMTGQDAAEKAGYAAGPGARVQASNLLTKPNIVQRVAEIQSKYAKRFEVSAEKVLSRLDSMGDVDLGRAYGPDGNLLPIHEIPEDVRKCIASIEVFEEFEGTGQGRVKVGEVRKVKFYDKIKANELLGKNVKLFTDRVEHSGKLTLEDLVVGSNEKDKE